ncbi:MAG: Uncharacterized protein Athens041674_734 [Parcubacteria group bacterium Athens0416_74]|nr:MAG: Uncharacterized protein Athens041674_734 [Parcubacteria group bacterium Athens0416_74]
MTKKLITIQEVPNVIDDHLLDIIGNEFKFDHAKGMAEWLKNSVDAYRTSGIRQEDQYVVFRFTDAGVTHPTVECIDFVGMSSVDIEKAFKRWGDPNASKRGKNIKTYGGHGNGGKFYMRQMFKESRFITYKNGVLNVFGFSENRKYGFATGYQDKTMSPKEALAFAEIASLPITKEAKERVIAGETGFTVIQGIAPEGVKGKFKLHREIERFKNHPQSRRILQRANVSVIHNGESWNALLKPDVLDPLAGFEEPRVVTIPATLSTRSGEETVTVEMANKKYPSGKLILRTSAEALARGSKLGELNRIDILGEIGVIGTYQLSEMGVTGFPYAAFIYGEFGPATEGDASILEDHDNDCVSNDRSKLVVNDTTRALIEWIGAEVDKLANEIGAVEREKQKENQKEITSKFNDVLNEWKNKHMSKIMSDLFGAGNNGRGGKDTPPHPVDSVSAPLNGFDFRFPEAEIQIKSPARITLKASVPQALPIGATVFFSCDSDKVSLDETQMPIKSDYLKATDDGQEVAFINLNAIGDEVGAIATITAKAGKLIATMKVTVVPERDNKGGRSFPQVLLSGHNPDPLNIAPGGMLILSERDPVVYQRPQDVAANIFWINTSSPMASKILDKFTSASVQWRNFLFERYVDIFVKEAVHELERKDYQSFSADSVDQKISEVVRRVHQSANEDLDTFLFDASYQTPNE